MTYLAVAVSAVDTCSALAYLRQVAKQVDLAELRLDLMQSFDLPQLLADRSVPVIITCRPAREGGRWRGSERERLAVLRQACALGADYVDLEWDVAQAIGSLDRSRTQVILSRHDFTGMPADLSSQVDALWAAGPDVVKVVGMAHALKDCLPVLNILKAAVRPTIAIAMGASGLATRLLAYWHRQAFLSFAAADGSAPVSGLPASERTDAGTAPGQIALGVMRDVYRIQSISATTKAIGLIQSGADVSPLILEGNAWLLRMGLDAVVLPLALADGEDSRPALAQLRDLAPFIGYLVKHDGGILCYTGIADECRRAFASATEALQWLVDHSQPES